MPSKGRSWTRTEIESVLAFYFVTPFGQLHMRNPDIIAIAKRLDRTPGSVAYKLVNLANCDPEILASGRKGASNASRLDKQVFAEFREKPESLLERIDSVYWEKSATKDGKPKIGVRIGEDILRTVKVRRGQAFFRSSVAANFDNRCAISGLDITNLLIASHIIPWKDNKSKRCDPSNGLLLSSLHDRAFDCGLITLSDSLAVVVSPKVAENTNGCWRSAVVAYEGKRILLEAKAKIDLNAVCYHRENVFLA